ncbi:MAG: ATP-binding protein, partial [Planctomycetota bacterium]
MNMSHEELIKKWGPVLEHTALPSIKDSHRRIVTAQLLENTENALREGSSYSPSSFLSEAAPTNNTTVAQNYDPVLITLVRRAMPNLIAYDIAGVQPMTGPTGLIFAMRSQYVSASNNAVRTEAFYDEADTDFSGTGTFAGTVGTFTTANTGTG